MISPPCVRIIPPRQMANARVAGVFSPSPFMERGLGGEVTTPMASAMQMDWIWEWNVMIVDTGNGDCRIVTYYNRKPHLILHN